MSNIQQTADDVEEQRVEAAVYVEENGHSKFPGSSYEDGVSAALAWVLGDSDEPPMAD